MKKRKGIKLKHKLLIKKLSEHIRKGKSENMGKIMKELGYSQSYTKNPNHLKETKSWKDLMEQYFSDEDLAKLHKKLLEKKEILLRNNNTTETIEQIDTGQPHSDAKGALDMAYKLKQKYGDITIKHKFGELSDEELEAEIADIISEAVGLTKGKK